MTHPNNAQHSGNTTQHSGNRLGDAQRDRLRDLLQAGDPLAPGDELSRLQATRIRNAMLAEVRHTPPKGWRLAAVAAALSVTLGSAYLLRLDSSTTIDDGQLASATGPSGGSPLYSNGSEESKERQIQFTTRGGTRVIWLLKPKLDLESQ